MPDTSGRLAPDRVGFSMPVTDPPVDGPPYSCRGFGVMALADDAAAAIVPEGLTIAHSPAIAQLIFTDFHFSTLGADIAADPPRAVPVGAAPMAYCASLLTTDEVNLIGGREPSGLPGAVRQRRVGRGARDHLGVRPARARQAHLHRRAAPAGS